ncbi:binding-protein-dependent transport systems inner membrane component [Catenulispora acidiphila DSM 44928]|uniref:Binding-protein-dependent transport systems inner membrane component n=1 Tax=Catenulispora acidiphila (strain DSM 44928 / JCM 14897 / NBRC 102108 / NRRL B-24433 / ID139908) TaxID=479433 RepID=C7QD89_CATAD|nr:ABC transporter permease [Catenulispora acidiphila]ACU72682.1 binding-protein-dependent transport systems inner membrane component [Catenulispora acidiphila DSM 44928]
MTSTALDRAVLAGDEPAREDVRVVRRRLGPGPRIRFAFWIGPALLVTVWVVGSLTGFITPQVLTAPWDVAKEFGDQWTHHDLLGNITASLRRAGYGLALGTAAGFLLALASGLSRLGEAVIDGPIQIKRAIPTLALIPLFVAWFGIGEQMKIITIGLISMIPIYINTHNGLRGIDGRYAELAETLDIRRGTFLRHVVLPGALPGFLLGLRFAVTAAMLGLVVVEQYNSLSGIGHMMTLAQEYGQTSVIVVGLVLYGFYGFLADAAVRLVERKALSWRRTLEG